MESGKAPDSLATYNAGCNSSVRQVCFVFLIFVS